MDWYTAFLIVAGATSITLLFFYGLLRYDCWLEGRDW